MGALRRIYDYELVRVRHFYSKIKMRGARWQRVLPYYQSTD